MALLTETNLDENNDWRAEAQALRRELQKERKHKEQLMELMLELNDELRLLHQVLRKEVTDG